MARDYFDVIAARTESQRKYDRDHTIRYSLKFNLKTDNDIIHWIWHQDSFQGAIKKLIRQDIARGNTRVQE